MTKITIENRKPRNPVVAPCRLRLAGSHRPSGGALRQRAARDLAREVDDASRLRASP